MAEKQPPAIEIDRSPTAHSDWPSLIERAVDDISRILQSEGQIFQTRLGAALDLQISNAVTLLTIGGVIIAGVLCILCAAIFLLHQWFPWWQAFGIAGVVMLIIGIVCNATMRPRSDVHT
ncbi:MAG: phage holin family protein [Candidatus Binataceae bacterium]|jgi:hypothetical protein